MSQGCELGSGAGEERKTCDELEAGTVQKACDRKEPPLRNEMLNQPRKMTQLSTEFSHHCWLRHQGKLGDGAACTYSPARINACYTHTVQGPVQGFGGQTKEHVLHPQR